MDSNKKTDVKSIKELIWISSGKFLKIMLSWEEIAGKNNAKIMMPVELKDKILKVAVPNSIVLSAISKFEQSMIKRANAKFNEKGVVKIIFFIDPSKFKAKRSGKKQKPSESVQFSQEEFLEKKQELIQKFNLNEKMAGIAANIELTREKKKTETLLPEEKND